MYTLDPIPYCIRQKRLQQGGLLEGDLGDEFTSVDESLKSYDTLQFEELLLESSQSTRLLRVRREVNYRELARVSLRKKK